MYPSLCHHFHKDWACMWCLLLLLNCANKILTLSYITLITEVFLESIHQRQTKHSWVESFHPELSWVLNQKGSPRVWGGGRDESNGGNCVFLFCFFPAWETREGDGQQQRGWTIKRVDKSEVKGQRKMKIKGLTVNIPGFHGAVPTGSSWQGASESLMLNGGCCHNSWEVMASAPGWPVPCLDQ